MVEEPLAVDVLERGPALARRAQQPGGSLPIELAAREHGAAQRPPDVLAQPLAEVRQGEAPLPLLGDDSLDREPAQDPRQRVGVGADGGADLRAVRGPSARTSATPSRAAT